MASITAVPPRRARVGIILAAVAAVAVLAGVLWSRDTSPATVRAATIGGLPDPVAKTEADVLHGVQAHGPTPVQYVQTSLSVARASLGSPLPASVADRPVYLVVAKGAFSLVMGGPPDCSKGTCATQSGLAPANQVVSVIGTDGELLGSGAAGGDTPFAALGTPATAVVDAGA